MNQIMYGFIPLALLFLLFLVMGLILRKCNRNRPASALRMNIVTKISETIILFSTGLLAFIYIGCFSDSGTFLILDQLRPAFATTQIILAAIVVVLLSAALLLYWFGRTGTSVVLVITILYSYNLILNNSVGIIYKIAPTGSADPVVSYTIRLYDESIKGAELWINKVYMGKMPVTITIDDFLNKVPIMQEPPEGYTDDTQPHSFGIQNLKDNWYRLKLPQYLKSWESGSTWVRPETVYYYRVKFGDEWGQGRDNDGGGGGGGRYKQEYSSTLFVTFPAREKRFANLMNKARIADYRVEQEWFTAMETYGQKGFNDLLQLAEMEDGYKTVLNDWVRWKYKLEKVVDQKTAMAVFKTICSDVDKNKVFSTTGIAARAIEAMLDKLDIQYLIKKYQSALRSGRQFHSSFGYIERTGSIHQMTRSEHKGKDVLPASTSAIWYALQLLDKKFDKDNYNSINIIEERITPEILVSYQSRFDDAVSLGGPAISKFLLRQNWYDWNNEKNMVFGGVEGYINKWLLLLANLDDPAGREFRLKHGDSAFRLADVYCEKMKFHNGPPEFLFLDLELGDKSLAYQYWPKYSAAVEVSSPPWQWEKISKRFTYLAKMEPVTTLDMYLDVWKDAFGKKDNQLYETVRTAAVKIPADKRDEFLKVLFEQITMRIEQIGPRTKDNMMELESLNGALRTLNRILIDERISKGDTETFQEYVASEGLLKYEMNRKNFENSLRNTQRFNPGIVRLLSDREESILRMMAFISIQNYPTRENRDVLEKLLNDSDEQVRSAAEQVAAELEEIKNMPVERLVSEPKGN